MSVVCRRMFRFVFFYSLSFIFPVTSRYVFICSRLSCLKTFDITARLFFRSEISPRYRNRCRFKGEFPRRRIGESQKLSPFWFQSSIPITLFHSLLSLTSSSSSRLAQCKISSHCLSKTFFSFSLLLPPCRYLRWCSSNFLPPRSRALFQTHSICFERVCKKI